jgi:hypothetical protein
MCWRSGSRAWCGICTRWGRSEAMIKAGKMSQIKWTNHNWIFLDIGFSGSRRTCGLILGNDDPTKLKFGEAQEKIIAKICRSTSAVNLVIEAPLSVYFSKSGNPVGRRFEKQKNQSRYWYCGAGAAVMTAAMYLIRRIHNSNSRTTVRLFESFISYKKRGSSSNHVKDVTLLQEVVKEPETFSECILPPKELTQNPDDKLFSAFNVLGLNCGIPAVIKR